MKVKLWSTRIQFAFSSRRTLKPAPLSLATFATAASIGDFKRKDRRNCKQPIAGDVGLGDRHNMIFSGTAATCGRGKAVITMQTQVGLIAGMLKEAPTETTPLQKELTRSSSLARRAADVVVTPRAGAYV